jgi:hypothetical protein
VSIRWDPGRLMRAAAFAEYFGPLDGVGGGGGDFPWTAAMALRRYRAPVETAGPTRSAIT